MEYNVNKKVYKAIYYWEDGLRSLLKYAKANHIINAIENRLNTFNVCLKDTNILGWKYSKDITPDTLYKYDLSKIKAALEEERLFIDICKPIIFKHYKELQMESIKTAYTKIETIAEIIRVYELNQEKLKEDARTKANRKDYKTEMKEWVALGAGVVSLILGGVKLYQICTDERSKKK